MRGMGWMVVGSVVALAATTACGPKRSVTRTAATSTEGSDLSGYWNDRDAQEVARVMIEQCLRHAWTANFQAEHGGRRPVVKLAGVIKRTDDRNVNTQFFSKQLEEELLNSGRVRVVAADVQDEINRAERDKQALHASDETAAAGQMETGADFTLQTVVNSQNDTDGEGRAVRAYLINMELVTVETQEKVWIKSHTIRKVIEQAGTSW